MHVAKMNRRTFLAGTSAALASTAFAAKDKVLVPLGIPARLEPLGFDYSALAPHIDAATLRLHHDVHHAELLEKLEETLRDLRLTVANVAALMGNMREMVLPPDPRQKTVRMGGPPERPSPEAQQRLRVYGGGHVNHTLFWRCMTPPGSGPQGPEGKAAAALAGEFGSVDEFKAAFTAAALRHFGSGWAWLVCRPDGKLVITTTGNEDNPLMSGFVRPEQCGRPILCLDLWEHSYYTQYQNDRKKHIEAWWNVVNWRFVSKAYNTLTSSGRG